MADTTPPNTLAWQFVSDEIADTLKRLDAEAFAELSTVFKNRERRWFFAGQGRSALVAQMAAMRFMHLDITVHFAGEATAPSIRKDDGLLIISGSGETPVSLCFARTAKEQGALIATLTHQPKASLANLADVVLPVPLVKSDQFGGSLFEQVSLILLDSMALMLMDMLPDPHRTMQYRHANLQ